MFASRVEALYKQWVIDQAPKVLVLMTVIVMLALSQVGKFELDASADSLTLEGDKDVEYYRQIQNRFPSTDDFLVLAISPNGGVFSEEGIALLAELKQALLSVESVQSINSILDVPLLHHPELELTTISDYVLTLEGEGVALEVAKQELLTNPLYQEMLVSADAKTTAMQLVLVSDESSTRLHNRRDALREKRSSEGLNDEEVEALALIDLEIKARNQAVLERNRQDIIQIREIMQQYRDRATLFLGGVPMIVVDMIEFVRGDLQVFGAGVLLFLMVTLVVIFRKVRWVVLPLFSCAVTIVVMVGYLGWARFPVTVISSNFISLLLIITMSMIIHLSVRYREYAGQFPDMSQRALVLKTVVAMSRPCLYTSLTTMVAFGSLLISGIRPVIDFGYMMTIGIVFAYLFAFILFPAILACLPREHSVRFNNHAPFSRHFATVTDKLGNRLVGAAVALGALCLFGISLLTVENRFIDYFKESTEIHQGMKVIDQSLGGTTPLDIVIAFDVAAAAAEGEGGDDEDCFIDDECMEDVYGETTFFTQEKVELINRIHAYIAGLPEVGKVLSISTTLQIAERIKGAPLDTLELAFMNNMFPDELRGLLLDPYVNESTGEARFTARVIESDHNLRRQALLDRIEAHLTEELDINVENIRFTSLVVLYNNMLQSLFTSQILTLGFVLASILVMFLVLFRSLHIAVIAILPNVLAPAVVLGIMGLSGIPLDMMTITIAAISVGIAVDNTIHYLYRYRAEFAKDRNYREAMFRSHLSIGKAMYYTSITIILGFSILVFSNFNPTIYFGLFTGLAMLIALLASLTLLPQLILQLKPFGPEGLLAEPKDVSSSVAEGCEPQEGEKAHNVSNGC